MLKSTRRIYAIYNEDDTVKNLTCFFLLHYFEEIFLVNNKKKLISIFFSQIAYINIAFYSKLLPICCRLVITVNWEKKNPSYLWLYEILPKIMLEFGRWKKNILPKFLPYPAIAKF